MCKEEYSIWFRFKPYVIILITTTILVVVSHFITQLFPPQSSHCSHCLTLTWSQFEWFFSHKRVANISVQYIFLLINSFINLIYNQCILIQFDEWSWSVYHDEPIKIITDRFGGSVAGYCCKKGTSRTRGAERFFGG